MPDSPLAEVMYAIINPGFSMRITSGARKHGLTRRRIEEALAAHQRLAWIHPFRDGNGRVARLHTHLVLGKLGLTNGLWSPLRGKTPQ